MIVIKFGGAALADSYNVSNSIEYIKKVLDRKPVVVVSAIKDVTDLLLDTINQSIKGNHKAVLQNLSSLVSKHTEVANEILKSDKIKEQLSNDFDKAFLELESLFKSIEVLKECSPKATDYILSFGEKLCSKLVANILLDQGVDAEHISGEELIVTDSNFGFAYPEFDLTAKKVQLRLQAVIEKGKIPIVTGFIGANQKNETTTLGRGGSDFTASILAYCLNADEAWYLKEVDGIMTADPKIVKNAKTIPKISYEEVAELSYFGAKVLHPIAIHPLRQKNIASFIKNVYKFDFEGTEVSDKKSDNGNPVKQRFRKLSEQTAKKSISH